MNNKQAHWENIYQTKAIHEVSWFQEKPIVSLAYFEKYVQDKNAAIIDIGGGDSFLVDNLLALGYNNITVLDISATAIDKAKLRLGDLAQKVKWIVSDITTFVPTEKYDIWHDRAVFHFLNEEKEKQYYTSILAQSLNKNGKLIIGTFAIDGPIKCSGIEITQYSTELLEAKFDFLKLLESEYIDHLTPFNTTQKFVFAVFES